MCAHISKVSVKNSFPALEADDDDPEVTDTVSTPGSDEDAHGCCNLLKAADAERNNARQRRRISRRSMLCHDFSCRCEGQSKGKVARSTDEEEPRLEAHSNDDEIILSRISGIIERSS